MIETKDFTGNITVNCDYPLQEFLNLPEVPCQRDTEARLSKARGHLKEVRAEHCVVHLVRLTKDCTVARKLYSKGMVFRVDGNTRALNWEKQGSDYLPEKLIAITYEYEDLDQIRQSYDTFDSVFATEKMQQKVFGILTGFYDYTPKNDKVSKGIILTGMNKACHFMKPTEWNQSGIKGPEALRDQLSFWMIKGCLQALDELMVRKDKWCQPFIAAALMSLYYYGPNNQRLRNMWKLIEKGAGNTFDDEWDGVTHITETWKTGGMFGDPNVCKDTRWDNMDKTVSFLLYWIDKYMKHETGTKPGGNWKEVAKDYKNRGTLSSNN